MLARLYSQFHVADSANWPTVWKKAKDGDPGALAVVNHQGDPHKHAVTAAIYNYVGAGKKGSEIVAHFTGGNFGWSKDAVDACIAVLMVSGHLGARVHRGSRSSWQIWTNARSARRTFASSTRF